MATKTAQKPASKPAQTTPKGGAKSAVLASLAKNTAPVTTTPDVAPDTDFNWDSLPAATVAVYTRSTPKADLEATTPAFIKIRVTDAFAATAEKGNDSNGKPQPVWFEQECGTPERAEEFLKLARKYAGYKDYTLRGGVNTNADTKVRYAVKPRETRKAKS